MFGYVMENELKAIDGIMLNPERPFCAILGGSKVSTKITIIENLLEKVDVLVLGGGMTYTFAAAEGGKVGNSICEPDQFQTALDILAKAKEKGVKVMFAGDCMGEKAAEMAKNLKPGEVMLLENLRFYAEEEGKPRGLAEDATDEEKKAAKKALKEGPQ